MRRFKNLLLIIIFTFYLYPFYLKGLSLFTQGILYIVPLFMFFLNFRYVFSIFKRIKIEYLLSIIFIILLTLISLVLPIIYGTRDFSYFGVTTFILRRIIIYGFLLFCVERYYDNKNIINSFMLFYIKATCIYILFTILSIAIPSLKEAVISIIDNADEYIRLSQSYGYQMRFGWQGFSGFRHTWRCTLAIVFLFQIARANLIKYNYKFWLYFMILILGNFLYGRSGIVTSVLVIVINLFIDKSFKFSTFIKIVIAGMVILTLVYVASLFNSTVYEWFNWFSTPFINLLTTGSFNNSSIDHLTQNMYFWPGIKTFLVGSAFYTDPITGGYYMSTDAGLMRQIIFWGVIPTLIAYITLLISFNGIYRRYRLFVLNTLAIFLVYEFKGDIYQEILPIMVVIAIFASREKNNLKNKLRTEYD